MLRRPLRHWAAQRPRLQQHPSAVLPQRRQLRRRAALAPRRQLRRWAALLLRQQQRPLAVLAPRRQQRRRAAPLPPQLAVLHLQGPHRRAARRRERWQRARLQQLLHPPMAPQAPRARTRAPREGLARAQRPPREGLARAQQPPRAQRLRRPVRQAAPLRPHHVWLPPRAQRRLRLRPPWPPRPQAALPPRRLQAPQLRGSPARRAAEQRRQPHPCRDPPRRLRRASAPPAGPRAGWPTLPLAPRSRRQRQHPLKLRAPRARARAQSRGRMQLRPQRRPRARHSAPLPLRRGPTPGRRLTGPRRRCPRRRPRRQRARPRPPSLPRGPALLRRQARRGPLRGQAPPRQLPPRGPWPPRPARPLARARTRPAPCPPRPAKRWRSSSLQRARRRRPPTARWPATPGGGGCWVRWAGSQARGGTRPGASPRPAGGARPPRGGTPAGAWRRAPRRRARRPRPCRLCTSSSASTSPARVRTGTAAWGRTAACPCFPTHQHLGRPGASL